MEQKYPLVFQLWAAFRVKREYNVEKSHNLWDQDLGLWLWWGHLHSFWEYQQVSYKEKGEKLDKRKAPWTQLFSWKQTIHFSPKFKILG